MNKYAIYLKKCRITNARNTVLLESATENLYLGKDLRIDIGISYCAEEMALLAAISSEGDNLRIRRILYFAKSPRKQRGLAKPCLKCRHAISKYLSSDIRICLMNSSAGNVVQKFSIKKNKFYPASILPGR